jgi:hypothetical protein
MKKTQQNQVLEVHGKQPHCNNINLQSQTTLPNGMCLRVFEESLPAQGPPIFLFVDLVVDVFNSIGTHNLHEMDLRRNVEAYLDRVIFYQGPL